MTCNFCRDIGVECDCDEGPCPDCAEMLESTDDLEDKLSAALAKPGAYVADCRMDSIPGVLEFTPSVVTWESATPNVQNLSGGADEKAGLVVLDVCGTDVRVLKDKTIPVCCKCGKPAESRIESPTGTVGCLGCFQDFLAADGATMLLKGYDKQPIGVSGTPNREWHVKGENSSLADALLYLLLYIPHDEYFTPAFKSRFEAVAGPCEYMQVGTSLYIKILTPNADGVCLELSIDF